MTRRSDLPVELVGTSFRVHDRALHRASLGRLRASDLQRPFSGVRSIGLDLDVLVDRCRAYEPLLRAGEVFSHWTAAGLYGLPVPRRHPDERKPLEVTAHAGTQRARSAGVIGHVSARGFRARFHLGLPVIDPSVAWCQLASVVRADDLVALGDAIVTGPRVGRSRSPGLATIDDLRDALVWWGSCRGARALAAALPRVRVGAESRPETHLRLLLVDWGLPEPVVNVPIRVSSGRVFHPDLAYRAEHVALEYRGDRHRTDRGRWQKDLQRRLELEHAGWRVVEISAQDLYVDPGPMIARIRSLLGSGR